MDLHEALYTTRAMRRVTTEPIPLDAQARILDAAIRAPSGGNQQAWRFLLVDDPELIAALGPLYRDAMDQLWSDASTGPRSRRPSAEPRRRASSQLRKVRASAQWLAEHFETVPLYLFAFARYDPSGGSIYPAVWSAMLAARAEGVGSCLTVVLSMFHPPRCSRCLGVPRRRRDGGCQRASRSAIPTGRWDVAPRRRRPRGHPPQPVGRARGVHRRRAAVATVATRSLTV